MYVDEETAAFKTVADGKTYYFCSEQCLRTFTQPEVERRNLRRLIILSFTLGLSTFLFGFFAVPLPFMPRNVWLFLLATPVQFLDGFTYRRARHTRFNFCCGKNMSRGTGKISLIDTFFLSRCHKVELSALTK